MINIQKNRLFQWFSLFLVASIVGVFMQFSGGDLLTSVIQTKQPEPFNGTALPLLSAPDWVALSAAEWKLPFDQIPESKKLNFPKYDEDQLKLSTSKLGWTGSDKQIRNAKITFPVPYMAGYDSDMGSHLAIDIKVPDFTPVYAIGNGTVVKVSKGTSGFGVHLVIKHDNFPSFSDSTKKTTYYSSYNHLSDIIVAQGDIVVKGQKIALTGHSGTSTTPHLHFQIDNDLAPWHPYWPFTFQEAQAAGYSFDEAVTAGLGRDKALATTINPLLYVQKYLNMTSLPESKPVEVTVDSSSNTPVVNQVPVANQTPVSESTPDEKITSAPAASPVPDPVPTVTDPPEESIVAAPEVLLPATALKIITDQTFSVGVEQKITVKAVDAHGDVVKNYQPKNGVSLVLGLGGAIL